MSETEMTPAQRRKMMWANFEHKYGQYWLIYVSLALTATLSFISGIILPFHPDDAKNITVTFSGVCMALYFAVGFITNGEGAANYWFGKLTDHDKDNGVQKWIAGIMLVASVLVSLITSLAAAAQIAYLLGALSEFREMPAWAQDWIVWSIPTMWIANAVSGMMFKAFGDDAEAERNANSIIRDAKQQITKDRADARARYWKENAPEIARRLGEMEAENEVRMLAAKLTKPQQTRAYADDAKAVSGNFTEAGKK